MHLAGRERVETVFTIDRKDFPVYRLDGGQPLALLPEDRSALGSASRR